MTLGVDLRLAAAGAAEAPTAVPLWPGHQPGKVYLGTSEPAPRVTQDTVNDIGHDLGLEREFYINYTSEAAEDAFITSAHNRNRLPWLSYKASQNDAVTLADWAAIAAGTQDAEHNARAIRYRNHGRPIIVVWNGEPNRTAGASTGDFNNWRAAWSRIWNLYQAAGATNVSFVAGITDDVWFGGTPANWLNNTMLGQMPFLAIRCDKTPANDTYATRIPTILSYLNTQGFPDKMIGLSLTAGYTSATQTGAAWWTASWNYVMAHTDRIGAVAYHNTNATPPPTGDWRLSESAAKLQAFAVSASNGVTLVASGPSAPAAPVIAAGAPTTASIPITWGTPATPADAPLQGFDIWRQLGTTGTPVQVATVPANARAYSYTGLVQGTAYTLWINAFNAGGDSPDSNRLTISTSGGTVPTAPGKPTIGTITDTSVQLSWTPATSPVVITSYKVYDGTTLARTVTGAPPVTTTTVTGLLPGSAHSYSVSATNQSGEGPKSAVTPTTTTGGGGAGTTVVAYIAGDIAHASYMPGATATSNFIVGRTDKDFVLAVGDLAYTNGTLAQYQAQYDPTWGRFKNITYPTPGNHETPPGLTGYKAYWGTQAQPQGTTWYSFIKGTWLFLAFDSSDENIEAAQITWATNVLNNRPASITGIAAFWHHPRFSSGNHGNDINTAAAVNLLAANNADIVFCAHDHHYERFDKLNSGGTATDPNGIRHFVTGTGGDGPRGMGTTKLGSQVRITGDQKGVLRVSFTPTNYTFEWFGVNGATDHDGPVTTAVNPK